MIRNHTCIISYGDIFYHPNVIENINRNNDDIAVMFDKNYWNLWSRRFQDPLSDLESFKIDEKNFIIEIGEKVKTKNKVQGQYMGIIKTTPRGYRSFSKCLETAGRKSDITKFLSHLITAKVKIRGIGISDIWGEVDHPNDLTIYEEMLSAGDYL